MSQDHPDNTDDKDEQYSIGFSYLYGSEGVNQDYYEAVRWFKMAAEQGHIEAQLHLGNAYFYGKGILQNYTEALKWFQMAGERGNVDAQNNVGAMYGQGKGVAQDYEKAVFWLKMAAIQGSPIAQNSLGLCYLYGNGVKRNLQTAINWLLQCADRPPYNDSNPNGYIEAQFNLGQCYTGACLRGYSNKEVEPVIDQDTAIKWFRAAAIKGHTEAQFELGSIFLTKGLVYHSESDKKEALKWLTMAADSGHVRAIDNIKRHFAYSRPIKHESEEPSPSKIKHSENTEKEEWAPRLSARVKYTVGTKEDMEKALSQKTPSNSGCSFLFWIIIASWIIGSLFTIKAIITGHY